MRRSGRNSLQDVLSRNTPSVLLNAGKSVMIRCYAAHSTVISWVRARRIGFWRRYHPSNKNPGRFHIESAQVQRTHRFFQPRKAD